MVKATQKGPAGNTAEILDAASRYGFTGPVIILPGGANGMPIVVAHENTFMGRNTFRLQTLYRLNGALAPGKGLAIPVEYRAALITAIKSSL